MPSVSGEGKRKNPKLTDFGLLLENRRKAITCFMNS